MGGKQAMHGTKLAAVLTMALAMGGCVNLGGAKAPPLLMTLTPAAMAPAGSSLSGKPAEVLVINEPETDRRLSVQRVPVQVDEANVAYLQKALWVERPSRLFQRLLAETLRAKGTRLVLEAGDTQARGAAMLSGRLVDMGYDARSRSVVVRFDALREAGGALTTRRFEAVERGVAPDAASVAPALNRAANKVAAEVADWVG
ncbi:MAG: membrane integrity-associated transporter subunit PqiC [Sphingomonadales bacterium]|nr:membrane integrity-associated transporter subunit PqiC [Sphingomonadales bacterium]